ncbi:hypothetical protein [Flavobacterium sp. W20_MBD1_R3]|uniref:hypothetical protein n=1 Tax=Flavobacterium sp. W20_MBD1_R3 TaxID=3240278 RepID=UPI003F937658
MNTNYYLIDYFNESPSIIQIVWSISAVFLLIIIPLILYLKFLRGHLRENEKITAQYEKEYESHLINYLYSGNEEEDISAEQQVIIDQLKNRITNPFRRKIFIGVLLKLKNEISGEIAESIHKLYFYLGLKEYALTRLRHKKWYVVAKGIRELKQFHVKEAHDEIIVHINHPKREVRKEMQLYMVNLFYFEGLDFLDILETSLSEWDQIQLLEVLQRMENQNITNIKFWLNSSNDSVVIFSLKLAKIYNQFEAKDELIHLLYHINKKIRFEAIHVLHYLNALEAKEILKNKIEYRSPEEQIAFFKMMENLYQPSDELFLLQYIHYEIFEVKLSALKILKVLNKEKFNSLQFESSEPDFLKIVNYLDHH